MKHFYRDIRLHIEYPTPMSLLIAFVLTLIIGTGAGEIISRPINSYIQAFAMLVTLFSAFVTIRMAILWIVRQLN